MLETLDHTIRIGSTPTFLYFDLYIYIYIDANLDCSISCMIERINEQTSQNIFKVPPR